MNKKRIIPAIAIVMLALIFLGGCYNGTTLDLRQDVTVTGDVGFGTDVVPIFEESCSISGCHTSNGVKPDLSSDKAYNSLISGNYVDVNNPEKSVIYEYTSGQRTPPMPVSGADPVIAATILAWIQQGAQNN
ncbi:MAG TPA: hypothetical protein PK228_03020 [Saprospiraceae bacterium]|nr:hypothetical protein [Saprospiraceae bacterium]